MEQSPSETSSEPVDGEVMASYAVKYVDNLKYNLDWHAAILAVLLQEAGGAVEVSAAELQNINIDKAQAQISFNAEKNTYTIEGLYTEDES